MGVGYGIKRNYPQLANVDIIEVWNRQQLSAVTDPRIE